MAALSVIAVFVLLFASTIAFQKLFNDELMGALAGIGLLFGPLLVFGLVEWWRGKIDLWGNPVGQATSPPDHTLPPRPPTDRQLNFIDELIHERDVDADDPALHKDPETLEEASETITYLLSLPYRPDHDDL